MSLTSFLITNSLFQHSSLQQYLHTYLRHLPVIHLRYAPVPVLLLSSMLYALKRFSLSEYLLFLHRYHICISSGCFLPSVTILVGPCSCFFSCIDVSTFTGILPVTLIPSPASIVTVRAAHRTADYMSVPLLLCFHPLPPLSYCNCS